MSDDEGKPLDIDKDEVVEHAGYTLVGAGLGALAGGPVGLVVGGILGFLIGSAKALMDKEGKEDGKNDQGTGKGTDGKGSDDEGDE